MNKRSSLPKLLNKSSPLDTKNIEFVQQLS